MPTPEGGRHWCRTFLRTVIKDDVYCPHSYDEIETLVAPEVAARLDRSKTYGVFWFNRTRTIRKRVSVPGPEGWEYRWRRSVQENPKDQWIAIPVVDAGLSCAVVNAARESIRYNEQPSKTGRRFWEIPGGAVRCGACGTRMYKYAAMAKGHVYAYYRCSRLVRNGKDACSPDRRRTTHHAEKLEHKVWDLVSGLLKDPEQLQIDLEKMIEMEREGIHGDPQREAKVWLEKLSEIEQMRRSYQEQAAKGYMTLEELGAALQELDESRKTAERELAAIKGRRERIEQLERDKDTLLQQYAEVAPEAMDALTPEERHSVYKMLRLEVLVHPNETLEVSGAFGKDPAFSHLELVPRRHPAQVQDPISGGQGTRG